MRADGSGTIASARRRRRATRCAELTECYSRVLLGVPGPAALFARHRALGPSQGAGHRTRQPAPMEEGVLEGVAPDGMRQRNPALPQYAEGLSLKALEPEQPAGTPAREPEPEDGTIPVEPEPAEDGTIPSRLARQPSGSPPTAPMEVRSV